MYGGSIYSMINASNSTTNSHMHQHLSFLHLSTAIPLSCNSYTVLLVNELDQPPKLMFAVSLFLMVFTFTQSIPAMTPDHDQYPLQFKTFTSTNFTFLATPYSKSPIVSATICIPWLLQSSSSLSTVLSPQLAQEQLLS